MFAFSSFATNDAAGEPAACAQTAKIEGGFVRFPKQAAWLDDYLRELLASPNTRYDDQVDSTVFALAWISEQPAPAIIQYYRNLATSSTGQAPQGPVMRQIRVPGDSTTWCLISGRQVTIPPDLKMHGGKWGD
jgi:hypothetical protein